MSTKKILRVVTSDISLGLLKGQLAFLSDFYNVKAISSSGPNVEKSKTSEGVAILTVEMERSISLVKDFKSLINLYKIFRKEKPDIVHSITPKAGLLSMIAGAMARVPNRIHTFTGLIFPTKEGVFQKILIWADRVLCHFATKIYPEGQGVKQDLIKFGITKKELNIIANGNVNGIDCNYFDPAIFPEEEKIRLKQNLGIEKDDFVFIFLGRLVTDKGINELINTFLTLQSNFPKSKLLLLGTFERELDPLQLETEKQIINHPNIIHAGWQDDVRPYLAVSNALAFPSYREGFPNVVLQAGAMGLPAIVTNISGCNEIIIENENGVIIPSKNKEALLSALKRFVSDPLFVESLSKKARKLILERYQQHVVWNAILDEYRNILKESNQQ